MAPADGKIRELREQVRALQQENARLRAERAEIERLRDSEAELRALVAALPDVVLIIDSEGRYLRIAPTNPALLYKPAEQLLGKTFAEVFAPQQAEEFLGYVREALSGVVTHAEYSLEIDGEPHLFSAALAALDEHTVLWVARDISYRLELDRLKSEFLAAASHELRTPLTPLRLLVQQAYRRVRARRPIEPDLVERMQRQCERLARIVDDLLDVSLLEQSAFRLHLEMVDLREIIGQVVGSLRRFADDRQVHIDAPAGPVRLLADRRRIAHVLVHLVDNAIKYSEPGQPIDIDLEVDPASVRVSVRDYGRGLTEQQRSRVFDRYFRVAELARAQPGLGLGLYLSREIIRAHGGSLTGERCPGGGSRFAFVLPRTVAVRDGELVSPFVSAESR
ncbi:MAG: ATP-binding protein [Myxococcales bacterium]|jgi:two-component system phosphate regulon sensor histidine kinase PhoR